MNPTSATSMMPALLRRRVALIGAPFGWLRGLRAGEGMGCERCAAGGVRKADDDPGAPGWIVGDGDVAVVGERDFVGDGEAQAGGSGAAFAAAVQAHEPVEDALSVSRRDAGAVVVDLDLDTVDGCGGSDVNAAMGVADRVVDDVAEQALQVIGVAEGVHAGRRVEVDVEMVGRGVGDD